MKELKKTQEFFLIIFIGGNLDLELILRLWIEYTLRKFTIISKKKELLKKKIGRRGTGKCPLHFEIHRG